MASKTSTLENIKRVVQITLDSLNAWDYHSMMAVRSDGFKFRALPSSLAQKELDTREFHDLWHNFLTPTFKAFKKFEYEMIQIMTFNEDGTLMTRLEEFFDSNAYLDVLETVQKGDQQ
ncbi:hypothetical protein BST61_g8409 [Cercospora zeina]